MHWIICFGQLGPACVINAFLWQYFVILCGQSPRLRANWWWGHLRAEWCTPINLLKYVVYHPQVFWEVNLTITKVVEWTTFVFLTIQSTTGTATVINSQDMCSVLNMRSIPTMGILSDEIFMITRRLVLSALSSHVVQCWWCPRGTIVLLGGPRSIMGTWWPHISTTQTKKTSSVLTKTQSMFQGPMPTRMVPCYTSWKGTVANFLAFHMFSIESWHVLFAPSNKTFSRQSQRIIL